MNVREIRQRIFDQMDYFPDLQQYRDSVVRRMNDRYQEVCDQAHWLFLQKETQLQLRKKVEGGTSAGLYVGGNIRKLTCSGFTPTPEMAGQKLIDGNGHEFRIVRTLQDASSSDVFYIFVEPSVDGQVTGYNSSFTSGSPDRGFTILFERFQMPLDAIEILGIVDRDDDRGRLLTIGRKREEMTYLDRDNTGEPSVSIDDEFFIDPLPTNDPTLAGATGGNLLPSTTYAYKYTILREGRQSPPSNEVEVTLSSAQNAVTVSGLDDTQWVDATNTKRDSGIAKLVYRRDVTNDGPWILIQVLESGTTSYSDTTLVPLSIGAYQQDSKYYYSSNDDVILYNDPGPYQYMRFWFMPDTDRKLSMRYHRRPRDLQADNDTPEWPRHYHQLLVYLTLEDLFLQMGEAGQSQLYAKRGDDMMNQMKRRFLARDDVRKRFARWDRPRRFRNVYGIPTNSEFGGP